MNASNHLRDFHNNLHSDDIDMTMQEHQSKVINFDDKYTEYLERKEAGLINKNKFILSIHENAYVNVNCDSQIKSLR